MHRMGFALLLAASWGLAQADAAVERIRARGFLVVSVKKEGPRDIARHNDPAHFFKRDFELALVGAIAESLLGDASRVRLLERKRPLRLPAVVDGDADLGVSMFSVSGDRHPGIQFSIPYFEGGLAILHAANRDLKELVDLNGLSIAAMSDRSHDPGGVLERLARAQGIEVGIRHVDRFETGIDLLRAGDVAGLVAERANLDACIAQGNPDLRRSPLLTHDDFAIAVSTGKPELLEAVNRVLEHLQSSGQLEAMQRRFHLLSER
ncbi:MAG: transporter substrate-binding domain-containing protein [Gammaproteobacteria bacterium]|nr:transporter substrate-binding domain-containing protein [Gammaproteobacteria bacterium]